MTSSKPAITSLRQRMIEDMQARNLGRDSQRNHIGSCKCQRHFQTDPLIGRSAL